VHKYSHAFCTQDKASTLDILLDIKKLYPLISPPRDKRQQTSSNVSPESFSLAQAVGLNHLTRRAGYG
jgi:hypothetical protein